MQIYVKTKNSDQPTIQDIPNSIVLDKLKEYLLIEFKDIHKEDIELLINDLKLSLEEFGHFNFIHVKSHSGVLVEIDF